MTPLQTLEEYFRQIDAHHQTEPCVDPTEIDRFEKQIGTALPNDLKSFYRKYQAVELFSHAMGPTYRFVSFGEMQPTRRDILGDYEAERLPNNWYTVCDVLDGNYIAVELTSNRGSSNEANYIDCFHETFAIPGESRVIARSFTELLSYALQHGAGTPYFLREGFVGYGDAFDPAPE